MYNPKEKQITFWVLPTIHSADEICINKNILFLQFSSNKQPLQIVPDDVTIDVNNSTDGTV